MVEALLALLVMLLKIESWLIEEKPVAEIIFKEWQSQNCEVCNNNNQCSVLQNHSENPG